MSQRFYFKFRPDLLTLEGVRGGNQKSWENALSGEIGMKLGG